MSEEHRFVILAENRETAETLHFVQSATGTKNAWATAREVCKLGGEVERFPADDQQPTVKLEPKAWVVRHARRLDPVRRSKEPTVKQLEALATERGVTVPKKVADLIAELREAGQNNDGERREAA